MSVPASYLSGLLGTPGLDQMLGLLEIVETYGEIKTDPINSTLYRFQGSKHA
jgi:hypothetical protein